jgi:hypothetical protein
MTYFQLQRDATIAVIVSRLRDPAEYVRRVLQNKKNCKDEFRQPVVVRIGITGEGVAPHYRIEPEEGLSNAIGRQLLVPNPQEELDGEIAYTNAAFYRAYNGSSHEHQSAWGHRELQSESWSNHSMTFEDVRKLLGDLRGFKAKS